MRAIGQLARDAGGAALVEFALVLPVALLLYTGGVQLMNAIGCNRKVTITTRAMADMVAQNTTGSTSAAEVDSELAAAAQVMAPFPVQAALVRISEITVDVNLKTTVVWSRAINGTDYPNGKVLTIPLGLRTPGIYYLIAEVQYAYTPPASFNLVGPRSLSDTIYMVPRNTTKIDCADC